MSDEIIDVENDFKPLKDHQDAHNLHIAVYTY